MCARARKEGKVFYPINPLSTYFQSYQVAEEERINSDSLRGRITEPMEHRERRDREQWNKFSRDLLLCRPINLPFFLVFFLRELRLL